MAFARVSADRAPADPASSDSGIIPDDRCTVERRSDDVLVVRVRSQGSEHERLPDAVFSFRCGDPQYAYWLDRAKHRRGDGGQRVED